VAIGNKFYGKQSVAITGRKAWDEHMATRTWTDGGAVAEVMQAATAHLERIVAENATQSVSDYLSSAEAGLRVTDAGEIIIGVRVSNQEASMIVEIPIKKLIVGALSEMRPTLGLDPKAQSAVSALIAFGGQLASLGARQSPAEFDNRKSQAS